MKINKFKKVGTNKYRLYFDNYSLLLYEDVILKYNLLYKKDIDNDLLIEIDEANKKAGIYDTALKYIGIRMRSIKEMRNYLEKKDFDKKDIDLTIDKLMNQDLLNDKSFAKSYVNDKINLTNIGIDKIRNELERLGVEDEYIDEVSCEVDTGEGFRHIGSPHRLSFRLDHFTGCRFGLFIYSEKETGGSAGFIDFKLS